MQPLALLLAATLVCAAPAAATDRLAVARFSVAVPTGFQVQASPREHEATLVRPGPDGEAVIEVRVLAPDPEAEFPLTARTLYEAEKAAYADGTLGRIRKDAAGALAGKPARQLVITAGSGADSAYEAVWLSEADGWVVQLGLRYPRSAPPAAVLAAFDRVVASARWQ